MGYKPSHPRKVRGEAVHQTSGEKTKEKFYKDKKNEGTAARGHFVEGLDQKAVEATYLVPDVDYFVETPEVENVVNRIKLWLKIGYPVHLIGPTGCGKTSVAMYVAKELGRPVVWINGDESVTTTDLIGGYSQVETETMRDKFVHNVFKSKDILKADWVDNPLTLACKYGYTLVYNEFARTKAAANNVFLSVFEECILELPTKFGEERYINVHPDFNAILTSNSVEYAGIHKPQDALLDRMVGVYMDYYGFDTEVKVVRGHTGISTSKAEEIVGAVRSLRDALPDAQKPGTRACIMIAQGLNALNGQCDFEQLCLDVMIAKTSTSVELVEKQQLIKDAISGSV